MNPKYTREFLLELSLSEKDLIHELKISFFSVLKNLEKESIFPDKSFFLKNLDVATFPFLFKNYFLTAEEYKNIKKAVNYVNIQKGFKNQNQSSVDIEDLNVENDFFDSSLLKVSPSTREDVINAFKGCEDIISYNSTHDFSLLKEIFQQGLLTSDNLSDVLSEKSSWVLSVLNNATSSELKSMSKEMIFSFDFLIQEADGFVNFSGPLNAEINSREYKLKYIQSKAKNFLDLSFFNDDMLVAVPLSELKEVLTNALKNTKTNEDNNLFSTYSIGGGKGMRWLKNNPEYFAVAKDVLKDFFPVFWNKDDALKNKNILSKKILGIANDSAKSLFFNAYLYEDLSVEAKDVILDSEMVNKVVGFQTTVFNMSRARDSEYRYDIYRKMFSDLFIKVQTNPEDVKKMMKAINSLFESNNGTNNIFPILDVKYISQPEFSIDFFSSLNSMIGMIYPEAKKSFLEHMVKDVKGNFDKIFLMSLADSDMINEMKTIELHSSDVLLLKKINSSLSDNLIGDDSVPPSNENTNFIYRKESLNNRKTLLFLLSLDPVIESARNFTMNLPKDKIFSLILESEEKFQKSGALDSFLVDYFSKNPDFVINSKIFINNLKKFPMAYKSVAKNTMSYREFSEINILFSEIVNIDDKNLADALSIKIYFLSEENLNHNIAHYLESGDFKKFAIPLISNEVILKNLIELNDWESNDFLQILPIDELIDGMKKMSHKDVNLIKIVLERVPSDFDKSAIFDLDFFRHCNSLAEMIDYSDIKIVNNLVSISPLIMVCSEFPLESFKNVSKENSLSFLNGLKEMTFSCEESTDSLLRSQHNINVKLSNLSEDLWNDFLSQSFSVEEKVKLESVLKNYVNFFPLPSIRAVFAEQISMPSDLKKEWIANRETIPVNSNNFEGLHGFLFPELLSKSYIKNHQKCFEKLYNSEHYVLNHSFKITSTSIGKGFPDENNLEINATIMNPYFHNLAANNFEIFINTFYKKNQILENRLNLSDYVEFDDMLLTRYFANFAYPINENRVNSDFKWTVHKSVIDMLQSQMINEKISDETKEMIVDVINIFELKKEIPLNNILEIPEKSYHYNLLSQADLKDVLDSYSLAKLLDNRFSQMDFLKDENPDNDEMSSGFKI